MKAKILCLLLLVSMYATAQVGIGTTDPKAVLDIKSTNQASPSSTDGMLVPKIDIFPSTNPGVDQQGMLVYLTTTVGTNQPGFYYWDDSTTTWIPIGGDKGTLDQAYDFGGAGNGRTITADTGAVLINGSDGLVSTGTSGFGAIAPSGAGTKMFWNPRKVAFRAGLASGTEWDDANIGSVSVAFGSGTRASANFSTAFGFGTSASGQVSTAFGQNTTASGANSAAFGFSSNASGSGSVVFGNFNLASGVDSAAFGINSTASGNFSTSFGRISIASGENSFVNGINNSARSFGEVVLGIGATLISPSVNGATQFRAANATDRLLVIGNSIDFNNSGFVDAAERSDAMVILKNGLTRLPSTTNAMIDAADGKAIVTKEFLQTNSSGTLDQAYDFGGAGNGRTITADTGAVIIDGTDGFVSTGTINNGAIAPSGAGVKMFWNPRKAAFRAGGVNGTQWDDANVGLYSVAFGNGNNATGIASVAFGDNSRASGFGATAFGRAEASGIFSTAFGMGNIASGENSTVFGSNNIVSGFNSTAFGGDNIVSGVNSTAFGQSTLALGRVSTSFGVQNTASGDFSTAFGRNNLASSYGETVLGIGATNYTPSTNGETQFRTGNATDRLFVIGNAIDADNSNTVDLAERSDAMVVLKNGNTGIGVSTPGERLQVAGKSLFTNGFSSDNAALIYRNNTDYMFLGPQSGSSADGGAMALFGSANVSGGNAGGIDFNIPGSQVRMNHTNGSYVFRANSTSGYTATFELNNTGLEIGHNSASRALIFSPNSAERMRITPTGDFGIGEITPQSRLDIVDENVITSSTLQGNLNVNTNNPQATDVGGAITLGGAITPTGTITRNFASIESRKANATINNAAAYLIFKTNVGAALIERMRINELGRVGIGTTTPGGQLELALDQARKPGTATWTIVSDERLKTISGDYTKGLNEILRLNPVTYNYKNVGKRVFEEEVLRTVYSGFIAQEVQQIFPEAVGTDDDGYLNFNMHPILVATINAFKELNTKNSLLEQEVSTLKQEIQTQKDTLQQVLQRLQALENKNN